MQSSLFDPAPPEQESLQNPPTEPSAVQTDSETGGNEETNAAPDPLPGPPDTVNPEDSPTETGQPNQEPEPAQPTEETEADAPAHYRDTDTEPLPSHRHHDRAGTETGPTKKSQKA